MFSQKLFYDRLMELKDSLGLSQSGFAREIGVNSQNISSYRPDLERPSMPKADFIYMVGRAFPFLNIKYILGLEENMKTHKKDFTDPTLPREPGHRDIYSEEGARRQNEFIEKAKYNRKVNELEQQIKDLEIENKTLRWAIKNFGEERKTSKTA